MKRIYLFVVTALAMLVCSCEASPEDHREEIEDVVKFYVAYADYLRKDLQNPFTRQIIGSISSIPNLVKFSIEKITADIAIVRKESGGSVFDALEQISKNENFKTTKDAKKVLEYYQKIRISLPDFELIDSDNKSKRWRFTEKRSGIKFWFEVFDLDKEEYTWMCSPDEKSYIAYVNR